MTRPTLPPHLAVMQQLFNTISQPCRYPGWRVVPPQPSKPVSCVACRDTGDTESGRACNWCSIEEGK